MGSGMAMAQAKPWSVLDFVLIFLMWAVMMVGMMLPSATPMILLYATVTRKQQTDGEPLMPVGLFASGYLIVWTAFSLVAAALQWALEQTALLSPMMVSASPYLGGAILIAAGVYQLTPLKTACLKHCRTPISFAVRHWRTGTWGTLVMGMHHGAFCVGCCWALMTLLFVGGRYESGLGGHHRGIRAVGKGSLRGSGHGSPHWRRTDGLGRLANDPTTRVAWPRISSTRGLP